MATGRKTGGRQKGKPNKSNEVRTERARSTGALPSENMLTIARNFMALAAKYQPRPGNVDAHEGKYAEFMKMALDANNKAAPYFEQRLASVSHTHRFDLSDCTDAELEILERIQSRQQHADTRRDQGRAGATLQ